MSVNTNIDLDEDDLTLLDEIQDTLHAGTPDHDEDLLNAKGKGKPCGESFIEDGDKCHVGEASTVESDKELEMEQKADRAIAADLYSHIKKAVSSDGNGVVDSIEAVDAAAQRMTHYKDSFGWRDRTFFFDWDKKSSAQIADAVQAEKWPTHGPMADVIEGLSNGLPHSFIRVGKYIVDPYLKSRGVNHEDINKFGNRLADIYEEAGIAPTGPPEPAFKPKASTASILGGMSQLGKISPHDDDHPSYQKEFFPKEHTYVPVKAWVSAGAVVFNDKGLVAIRKVKGGYGGYGYSWGKGKVEDKESHEQAAHREVLEEQGHAGTIVGDLGMHKGTSSDTHFYLMRHVSDHPDKMDNETEKVEWVTPEQAAEKLDSARDLKVLVKAMVAMRPHLKGEKLSNSAVESEPVAEKTLLFNRAPDGTITGTTVSTKNSSKEYVLNRDPDGLILGATIKEAAK